MGIWSFWLILGAGLLIAELLTLSTTCLYIGVGALGAMAGALLGGDWLATIIIFIAFTTLLYVTTYKWRGQILKALHKEKPHSATGMEALIGRTSQIEITDSPRIKIDGDTWKARAAKSGTELRAGDQVRVVGYDSIILLVEHTQH